MTRWKLFWAGAIVSIAGLSLWRNCRAYKGKSKTWLGIKTLADVTFVLGLAVRMPMLLGTYVIIWLTRPLKEKPLLRATVGAFAGIAISFFSAIAMEVIVISGIFAIDQVTGGIWNYWNTIGRNEIDWKAELGFRRKAR